MLCGAASCGQARSVQAFICYADYSLVRDDATGVSALRLASLVAWQKRRLVPPTSEVTCVLHHGSPHC